MEVIGRYFETALCKGRLSDIIDNAINEFRNSRQDFYIERAAAKSDEDDTLIVIGNYDGKTNEYRSLS